MEMQRVNLDMYIIKCFSSYVTKRTKKGDPLKVLDVRIFFSQGSREIIKKQALKVFNCNQVRRLFYWEEVRCLSFLLKTETEL